MARGIKAVHLHGSFFLLLIAFIAMGCGVTSRFGSKQGKAPVVDTARYENLLIEAKKQQILDNPQKALELYEELVRLDPKEPLAYYELARIHQGDGRNARALELSMKASELAPSNKWYHLLNADLMMSLSRFSEAADEYSKAVKLDEGDPDLYLQLAAAQVYAGKYKDAIKTYDQLETLFGINEDVCFEKHRLYLLLNNTDGAIRELEKLIESVPNEPRYYGALAEFYSRLGNKVKAVEYFNKVLEVDPNNPQVRVSLADHYRQEGDDKRAFDELMTAFRSTRLDIDSKVRILLTYYSITETTSLYKKEAYRLLDTLVSVHPNEAKAWSIYGDFLVRDKKNEEALKMFTRVLQLDSTRYPVWEQVLTLHSAMGNTEGLISDGARTVALFPEQPLPYLFEAVGLLKQKRYEEAIKLMDRGLFFVTDDNLRIQFLTNIAQANYELGKKQKAYSQFDQILVADPNNTLVLNNYAYFLALDGDRLDEAFEMASKAVESEPDNPTYLDTYAWVCFKQKDYTMALQWIDKAMKAGGDSDHTVLEHYGDILYFLDRKQEARNYWNQALQKDDSNKSLQEKVKTGEYHE